MKKQNEGITLVALVITIIVLIILAGVSINAVMNGGLITNAKDAKNEYEEGKAEETNEIENLKGKTEIYMAEKELEREGIKYNTTKKYITGIKYSEETVIETVSKFMERMPGYVVYENGELASDALVMTTGMVVKKKDSVGNEVEIGTVIVYGDVNIDREFTAEDATQIANLLAKDESTVIKEEYQKIAADVNHDGVIDSIDVNVIQKMLTSSDIGDLINQDFKVRDALPTVIYSES